MVCSKLFFFGAYVNPSFCLQMVLFGQRDGFKGMVYQGNFEVKPEYPFANGWPQLKFMLAKGL
jgi:hypothetical protein